MVKYPPCNAGDTGLIPSWGTNKIPYATEQVSPCAVHVHLEPALPDKKSHCSEKPVHCKQSVAPQLERAQAQEGRASAAKKKERNLKKNEAMGTSLAVRRLSLCFQC